MSLYLATDGDIVTILQSPARVFADQYASKNGLTILTTKEGELERLVKMGAEVTEV